MSALSKRAEVTTSWLNQGTDAITEDMVDDMCHTSSHIQSYQGMLKANTMGPLKLC